MSTLSKLSLRRAAALAIVAAASATPLPAQAVTLSACYVPNVGAMYMIKQTGLPQACLASSHAEISWSDSGSPLADGAVVTVKLGDAAVTSAKIADLAVTVEKLAAGVVTSEKLADGAVSSAKLADGAVSSAKLADGAVSSAKLADASVTQAKLAADVVLAPGPGSVTGAMIAPGAVNGSHIEDAAVTSAKIPANGLNLSRLPVIGAASVLGRSASTSGDVGVISAFNDGSVLRRSAGTVSFGQIVTAGIADGAVTPAKLSARPFAATGTLAQATDVGTAIRNLGSVSITVPAAGQLLIMLTGYAMTSGDDTAVDIGLSTTGSSFNLGSTVSAGTTEGTGTVGHMHPFTVMATTNVTAGLIPFFGVAVKDAGGTTGSVHLVGMRIVYVFFPN